MPWISVVVGSAAVVFAAASALGLLEMKAPPTPPHTAAIAMMSMMIIRSLLLRRPHIPLRLPVSPSRSGDTLCTEAGEAILRAGSSDVSIA
ncbi:hypothetical protein F4778DRAFT_736316 [Xylariomycetidae sp. FL2044]|nr:hypothetical protein F4778DRAFT_736316 [Xylariomycetidae sp. FL2044]